MLSIFFCAALKVFNDSVVSAIRSLVSLYAAETAATPSANKENPAITTPIGDIIDDSIALRPPITVPASLKPAIKEAILGITGAITIPIPNIAVVVEPNISVTFVNASIKLVNALIPTLTAEEFTIVDQKV